MTNRFDYIILDFNGTLITTEPNLKETKEKAVNRFIQSAYKSLNYTPPTQEAVATQLGQSPRIEDVLKRLSSCRA